MKYSEILNKKQYSEYCKRHLELGKTLAAGRGHDDLETEYYILELIIEDYNKKQDNPFDKLSPVDLLEALMEGYEYSGLRLSKELKISPSVLSDVLNYKRGFSKDLIRKLSEKFGLSSESFLKDYELKNKEFDVA